MTENWDEIEKEFSVYFKEMEAIERRTIPEGLKVTWEELMTPQSWRAWLDLAKKKDEFLYQCWSDVFACMGCRFLDRENIWCRLQGLPATFNPYLTPRTGLDGMACMGMGKEVWMQLDIFGQPTIPV